jgi:hypothetical protein
VILYEDPGKSIPTALTAGNKVLFSRNVQSGALTSGAFARLQKKKPGCNFSKSSRSIIFRRLKLIFHFNQKASQK